MHRSSHPSSEQKTSTEPGELVHADLAGSMQVASPTGSKYYLLIKDDFSNYTSIYLLRTKSETTEKFEEYIIKNRAHGITI